MSEVINDMQYKTIDSRVNSVLAEDSYSYGYIRWSIIIVCVPDDIIAIFPEVVKRHAKRKVLEFRLQINYDKFFNGSEQERYQILFDNMSRSVELMLTLKVPASTVEKLREVVQKVRSEFCS